ncbi:MAG: 1-aminocyclopropane-1-carboxylate deaminase [Candidatus Endobugula sp.]
MAIKGCAELIDEIEVDYDIICSSVGTGGTLAGLISGLKGRKRLIGFAALKGDFLRDEVQALLTTVDEGHLKNWSINTDYHFGGYAKKKPELLAFIETFEKQHGIPLEPIYTGKMMFGLFDLVKRDAFDPGTKILAVHTGGIR